MIQASSRHVSSVAKRAKPTSGVSVGAIRCFSSASADPSKAVTTKKIPTYKDPLTTVNPKSMNHDELVKMAEYKAERTRVLTRKSAKVRALTDYAVGDYDPLPENPAELGALSGMPLEHQNRTVIISNRYSSSFSSGDSYAHQWQVAWKPAEKWSNPLTGWTSGADPMSSLSLFFDSREEAIQHAERNGWKYELRGEVSDDVMEPGWRAYEHNFLSQRVRALLISQSKKPTHFANPNYGESGFFMPLKFHGDGEVQQHGGN